MLRRGRHAVASWPEKVDVICHRWRNVVGGKEASGGFCFVAASHGVATVESTKVCHLS